MAKKRNTKKSASKKSETKKKPAKKKSALDLAISTIIKSAKRNTPPGIDLNEDPVITIQFTAPLAMSGSAENIIALRPSGSPPWPGAVWRCHPKPEGGHRCGWENP